MNKAKEKDEVIQARENAAQGEEIRVQKVEFHPFPHLSAVPPKQERSPLFDDVSLRLSAELGKTKAKIRDFINLEEGSLLELNRPADENVLLLANEVPFARGEIVVINERFGVRIISFVQERRKQPQQKE